MKINSLLTNKISTRFNLELRILVSNLWIFMHLGFVLLFRNITCTLWINIESIMKISIEHWQNSQMMGPLCREDSTANSNQKWANVGEISDNHLCSDSILQGPPISVKANFMQMSVNQEKWQTLLATRICDLQILISPYKINLIVLHISSGLFNC